MNEKDKKLCSIIADNLENINKEMNVHGRPKIKNLSSKDIASKDLHEDSVTDDLISQAYDQFLTQSKCDDDMLITLNDILGPPQDHEPMLIAEDTFANVSEIDFNDAELIIDDEVNLSDKIKPFQGLIRSSEECVMLSSVVDISVDNDCNIDINNQAKNLEPEIKNDEDISEASTIATIIIMEIFDSACKRAKSLKRWRQPNPDSWKTNVAKKRRIDGLPYMTKNKIRKPKVPKPINCSKCLFKCSAIFSEDYRKTICRKYWNFDYIARKIFILANIDVKSTKTVLLERKRTTKRSYTTLCSFHLDNTKIKVCQKFFCHTLCISQSVLSNAIKNRDPLGQYSEEREPRGRHEPPNKTHPDKVQEVRNHIESFPSMESHYIRKDSKREYLDSKLSIGKMYSLYTEKCKNENIDPVSDITYRRIFATQYNLGFFTPKKDQCLVCTRHARDNSDQLKEEFEQHINRKEACNLEKAKDKNRTEEENNFLSASFDLQAILQIPSGDIGLLYYTRKLTIYNLTVYESAEPNAAYCFTWSEVNGKKGSSEIGSILLHYLSKCVPSHVNEVSLFSDTCGGQNRNKYVAGLLLWAVQNIDNLRVIEQKFLESGHTYMEVDSMHSSIESAQRNTAVYSMSEWMNVFKRARSKSIYKKGKKKVNKEPYHVKEFKFNEFKDLKDLAEKTLKNTTVDEQGNKVKWLKIKRIRYVKGETKLYFNYDMSLTFSTIDVAADKKAPPLLQSQTDHCYVTRNKKKSIASSQPVTSLPSTSRVLYGREGKALPFPELRQLYNAPLAITAAKKKDLVNLCNKGVIPEEYHHWYQSLKADTRLRDRIPTDTISDTDMSDTE